LKKYLSLKLALRFLFFRGSDTFSSYASLLAIGGLGIGVCSLLLTSSIINGFHDTVSNKLLRFEGSGRLGHIFGKTASIKNPTIDSLISKSPQSIIPFTSGIALMRFGSQSEGVVIEGLDIPPSAISELKVIENGNILIGKGIALSLNVKVGDKVYLQCISPKQSLSNIPIIKSFIVSDVFYSGLQEYDNSLVYISLNDSRSILSLQEDQVSGLIFFDQKFIPADGVEYPFYFETWKEKHALLFEWISIQRWPAYIIFSLIAVVGLVNLIAAIAMIIIEKTNQIGILTTQGLPYSALKNIFMIQGSFIGLCGGFFGGCLAAVLIFIQLQYEILKIPSDIYFMDHIPVSFDYIIFLGALIISLLLSLLASWFPVRKIASLNTANALRYE